MSNNNASVEYDENGLIIKQMLKPTDLKEEEENKIAKANAELVFTPKFIPFYPQLKRNFGLSWLETIIFGFVEFYLTNSESKKFYFTNKQLSEVTGADVSDVQISNSLKTLREKGLLQCNYKIRAGGGRIRFIENFNSHIKENFKYNIKKTLNITKRKLKTNNNKIKDNKINNLKRGTKPTYGNKLINFFDEEFKKQFGYTPTFYSKTRRRQRIWNLVSRKVFNKSTRKISDFIQWLKEYCEGNKISIEKLDTVIEKCDLWEQI